MITEIDIDVLPLTREGQIIGQSMSEPQFRLEEFEEYLDPYKDGLPAEVEKQLPDRTNYPLLFRRDLTPHEAFYRVAAIPQ